MKNRTLQRCLLISLGVHAVLLGALAAGTRFMPAKRPAEQPLTVFNLQPPSSPRGTDIGRGVSSAGKPPQQSAKAATPRRSIQLPAQSLVPVRRPLVSGLETSAAPVNRPRQAARNPASGMDREQRASTPAASAQVDSGDAKAESTAMAPLRHSVSSGLLPANQGDRKAAVAAEGEGYAGKVLAAYLAAWRPPEESVDRKAVVEVEIVVEQDGRVLSAEIVSASRNATMDRSVRQALNEVRFIEAFPADWIDSNKRFRLHFNLTIREHPLAG